MDPSNTTTDYSKPPDREHQLVWCTPIGKLLFLLVYLTHPQVVGVKQWDHHSSPKTDPTIKHSQVQQTIHTPYSLIPLIEVITPFIHPLLPVSGAYLDTKRIPYRVGDWFFIHSIPYGTNKKNITLQQFHILLLLTIIHTVPDITLPTIRYLRDYILCGDGYTCKHAMGIFLWRCFRGQTHEPLHMLMDIVSGCPPLQPIQCFQQPEKYYHKNWELTSYATIQYQLEKSGDYSTLDDLETYWRRKRVARVEEQCCYLVNAGLVASSITNNTHDLFIRDVHFLGEDHTRMLICGISSQQQLILEQYIQHRMVLHSNQPATLLFLSLLFDYDAQTKIAPMFDLFHQQACVAQNNKPQLQLNIDLL